MSLRGGTQVPAGVYRQVHSGRLVYLATPGTLPGQNNSEVYIEVPQAALLNTHRPQLPYFHTPEYHAHPA